ncbi:hypothetical protein POM88_040802 [Heracleum sosnowskyi]|uniref:MLO-like protein n=1 Tax=Heracleum sosnowskyi TaxID=360622 RepID=A0AAD8HDU2_9APIA|nr:hypothetical protein POM88_040802 [Heracleum sosnowskyi]
MDLECNVDERIRVLNVYLLDALFCIVVSVDRCCLRLAKRSPLPGRIETIFLQKSCGRSIKHTDPTAHAEVTAIRELTFHNLNSSRSDYQSISLKPDFFDAYTISGGAQIECSVLLKSAYQSISLKPDFFYAYTISGGAQIECSVLLKAICSVLRTPIASIDHLRVHLPSPNASKIQWRLDCDNDMGQTLLVGWAKSMLQVLNLPVGSLDLNLIPPEFLLSYTAPEAWEPVKKSLNLFWDDAIGISAVRSCTLVEMCTGSVPKTGASENFQFTYGHSVDWLGREMLEMRLRDKDKVNHDCERDSEPELVNGVGAEAGYVIRTTIGGRNGQSRHHRGQDALYEDLQKLKEELMLLGFISLLLTVSQGPISNMCISHHLASTMIPCKLPHESSSPSATEHFYLHQSLNNGHHRLLSEDSESQYCEHKGKVPLFSREALHQLNIFIFVLAVVHVIFSATTMVLGGLNIQQWKRWEQSSSTSTHGKYDSVSFSLCTLLMSFKSRTSEYWRKYRPIGWTRSYFKQFYGSVTKSDYMALQAGFIQEHCLSTPKFNFHTYMLRTLEHD